MLREVYILTLEYIKAYVKYLNLANKIGSKAYGGGGFNISERVQESNVKSYDEKIINSAYIDMAVERAFFPVEKALNEIEPKYRRAVLEYISTGRYPYEATRKISKKLFLAIRFKFIISVATNLLGQDLIDIGRKYF